MDISQIRGIIHFINAFLSLVLAFALWFKYKGKDKSVFYLGWAAFFSSVYCFTWGGRYFFESHKLFWDKATWLGVFILPAYITALYYITRKIKYLKLKSFFVFLPAIVIIYLALATPYFIVSISPDYPYSSTPGPLIPLGRLYVILCLGLSLFYLLRFNFKTKGFERWQIKYYILGTTIYSLGGLLAAGVIPLFYPRFSYVDIPSILSTIWVALFTYAIFKRRLFGVRVILTEILVGAIGLILLIQAFLFKTFLAKTFGFIIFLAFLLAGYLLIRATQKEIQRKEEAERLAGQLKGLNETLEDRVKERTKELEKSYFEIKKRKDELEKFYNLTIGRELKMVELKKEIQELKKKLGEKGIKNNHGD